MSTSATIGSRVRAYREGGRDGVRRRLTQEQLADQVGMSVRWLRMLEQGQVDPKLSELRKLAVALQVSERDLFEGEPITAPRWVLPDAPGVVEGIALQEADPVRRRELFQRAVATLGAVGGTVLAVDAESWNRLSSALTGNRRVDTALIDHLGQLTASFEHLAPQLSHRALLTPLVGHLHAITQLLDGGMTPSLRTQLASIAGETAALAGQLLWYQGDHREAGQYFHTALKFAADADDQQLGAFVLGRIAIHGFRPVERIRLLDEGGYGFHPRRSSPTTRAWLAWVQADAASQAGDVSRCLTQYEQIRTIFATQRDDQDARPRVPLYVAADLPGDLGGSLLRLGRVSEARTALTEALTKVDSANRIQRAWLLTAQASTYIQTGSDPDEAASVGMGALAIAHQLQAQPIIERVLDLSNQLTPWASRPSVAELRERLASRT